MDRGGRGAPFFHALELLQREQIRSPDQVLENAVSHLRHGRVLGISQDGRLSGASFAGDLLLAMDATCLSFGFAKGSTLKKTLKRFGHLGEKRRGCARPKSKVRRREAMYIVACAAAAIDLAGNQVNAFPRGIEHTQSTRLDIGCVQAQTAQFLQRIRADKKRNLDRAVIAPELDAVSLAVISAALVWKVQ